MSDSIIIPLKIEGEEKAQVAFNEVIGSLSRVQRKMLEMGGASEEGQRAILGLTQKFKQGEISAEEFRTSLIRLAGDAPKTAQEFAKAAREAEKLAAKESLAAQEAEKLARETKKAGDEAGNAAPKVKTLGDRFAGLATGARHANELAEFTSRLGSAVHGAAMRIGELASEQQRLDANSVRLGLNFRQAAEQAGGFVSEVETMTLATSLADRGIRATQTELNALARVGMSRAAATGKNLGEVFDSLTDSVLEGGEEMGKFGGNLLRVSDGTHTASERMRAFVDHAKTVPPTMRTAADEMARFNRAVHDAQRTVASAFAEEFGRLLSLPDAMHNSATNAEDLNTQLRAVGMTAAYVVDLVGQGAGAVLGFIAAAVTNVIVGVQTLGAGLAAIRGGPTAMRVAMDRRAQELLGPESAATITSQFASERYAAFRQLLAQGGPVARTSETPTNMPTLAQARTAAARNRAARNQRDSSGGGSGTSETDVELARIEAGLEMAARMSESERAARYGVEYEEIGGVVVGARDIIARLRTQRIDVLRRQTSERRAGESTGDRRRRVAQLNARIDELKQELRETGESEAATGRSRFAAQASQARREYEERIGRPLGGAGGSISERAESAVGKERGERETVRGKQVTDTRLDAQLAQERMADRERRMLDERRDGLRSFTDFMEGQYTRQVNLAREGADAVAMSVRAMGSAYADNLVAWAEGSKTFEEAANAMLATTLSTIAKEAAAKSAFNIAEGFFALATYRYDAAALHFAAAAGYGALAYGAGYAASAVREAAPKKEEDKSRGASEARGAAPMSQGSTTGGGTTVINVAFNGPQFGTGGVVQAARQLAGVLNAGAVQGGVQLNRLALAGTR